MEDRFRSLVDKEAIRELRILYAHRLDGNQISMLDEVFTRDAIVEVTVGVMRGLEEIRIGLAAAFAQFDRDQEGRYPFLHVIANHWIRITGPDTAEGRCYLLDFETARKPVPNPLLLLGLYADEYRRTDGAWRISRSRLEVVWPERNPGGGGEPGVGMVLPS